MPTRSENLAAMRHAPIFAALTDAEAETFYRRCRTRDLQAGEMLFTPTQPAERFYVVLAGQVRIYQLSPRGDRQIFHLFGPGNAFAEAAALSGGPYPAFAEASTKATVLLVARRTLLQAVRENPELAMGMISGLSAKLREFNRLIEELSLKEVPARLAGVLLRQARQAGSHSFRLSMPKRELAARIGTVSETLSRALAKLRKAGLVEVSGGDIQILDPEALEELAEQGQM
ncbi:MAG: Crp/Fnr family transcriptional regulator [Planctomycetota bacterium]